MLGNDALDGGVRRVLVADDHPLYRDALREVLSQVCPEAELFEAASQAEVLALVISDSAYDLILLDLKLPGAHGLSCLRETRNRALLTPIVVISAVDDPVIMGDVVMSGATAYLPKSGSRQQLIDAIGVIIRGGTYLPAEAMVALRKSQESGSVSKVASHHGDLTPRQVRVLELIADGLSNKAIAREMAISEITTKAHVSAILKKLGLTNRVQAAIEAHKILKEA
jgi:DNA-binding NarL/FixJ family response regulator